MISDKKEEEATMKEVIKRSLDFFKEANDTQFFTNVQELAMNNQG